MSPSDLNTCGEFDPRNQKKVKKRSNHKWILSNINCNYPFIFVFCELPNNMR